ncbi:MAG: hypothetical protein AAB074_04400 [Planctomycetota bacterium]
MAGIDVGGMVKIVKVGAAEQHLLNRVGRLLVIADSVNCLLVFQDGTTAQVKIDQLQSVR